jgi:hypothetical protein
MTAHGPNFSQPPLELIDGEEEYQVERIMGHRKMGQTKKLQYLVKWLGVTVPLGPSMSTSYLGFYCGE